MTLFDLMPWRRSPATALTRPGSDAKNWLDAFFGADHPFFLLGADDRSFVPSIEVTDDAAAYTVKAEVPGMNEKDIEVVFDNGDLIVRGEKKEEKTEGDKAKGNFRSELRYGKFERRLPFGNTVDRAKVEASYKDGVLTIKLPRTAEAKQATKAIPIKAGA